MKKEEKDLTNNKTQPEKEESQTYTVTIDENKAKLIIMVVLFVIIAVWVLSSNRNSSTKIPTPFNGKEVEEVDKTTDNFNNYTDIINNLSKKSHEYIFTVEPDKNDEYYYLRVSVDGDKSLYYKEWKNKNYTYLKKGSNFYILGVKTWKKTSKVLSYEGYDTLLLDNTNLYSLLINNKSYELIDRENTSKKQLEVIVDLNKLLDIYNNQIADINNQLTKPEDGTNYLRFYLYAENNRLNISVDLTKYYELVYGKKYDSIVYSLEYYHIGSTSLVGVEDFSID